MQCEKTYNKLTNEHCVLLFKQNLGDFNLQIHCHDTEYILRCHTINRM